MIAVASLACTADPVAREQGLLHGFDRVTWSVVLTQSIGGIIVAVCIKYAYASPLTLTPNPNPHP